MRDVPTPTFALHDLPSTPRALGAFGRLSRPQKGTSGWRVDWAQSEADVRLAQRLRYRVFAEELGARLSPPPNTPAGLDVDTFDPFCEHLLVRLEDEDGKPGEVIGTYRVLTPAAAKRAGGMYSETEFDLTRLRAMRGSLAELGRSCVHPDYRHGGVILALWSALASFMQRNQLEAMLGCASMSMRDGGHMAASVWTRLKDSHLAPIESQVRPRLPLPVEALQQNLQVDPPALIKGYLRCGAKILGAPAWDPDFNTADLPMMLRLKDLPASYRRHLLAP
ncbi:GNAT family N-acetyltransferase [Roseateles sp. BYS180W]|uniref:L-ornithine N(alpha)-acyltransferase n=1 Tax=Roseateles rivi TaxID=3299028 RepID=A0ABW7FUS0_9BURK